MYYQYELTHFKGDMGHGVASDDHINLRSPATGRACSANSDAISKAYNNIMIIKATPFFGRMIKMFYPFIILPLLKAYY